MNYGSPITAKAFRLRDIEANDRELLFEWRNIPEIISLSSNQRSVSWAEHVVWFDKIVSNDRYYVKIITEEERPIGQVRFEMTDKTTAQIGIYLIPSSVGQGRGSRLIGEASALAKQKWPFIQHLHAYIRQNNLRSIRAFEAAGFKFDANNDCDNNYSLMRMTMDVGTLR